MDGNVTEYSAVDLFVQTARQNRPGFDPDREAWRAILQICRLVQGMPLGLVLAAGWVEILTPQEIAAEIQQNMDFLESAAKDLPLRQRSMRAIFDHSWRLMTETERPALQQLSVFVGGFNREAAHEVTGASLRTLIALVNRSLVQNISENRYELHILLRQYTREKLAQDPEQDTAVKGRHSVYYCGRMGRLKTDLNGIRQRVALDEIVLELSNVLTAWEWATNHHQAGLIDQALETLYVYFTVVCQFEDGAELFHRTEKVLMGALGSEGCSAEMIEDVLVRLRSRRGKLLVQLNLLTESQELLQASLEHARKKNDRQEMVFCLIALGIVATRLDFVQAGAWLSESRALTQSLGDPAAQADTLSQLGWLLTSMGDNDEALSLYRESLALYRQTEYQIGLAEVLERIAVTAWNQGQYAEAEESWKESLHIANRAGSRDKALIAIGGLAMVAWAEGGDRLQEAVQLQKESVERAREIAFHEGIPWRLVLLGGTLNQAGTYHEALSCLQEAIGMCHRPGNVFPQSVGLALLAETMIALGRFAEARSHLRNSLTIAMQDQITPAILLSLVNISTFLVIETQTSAADSAHGAERYILAAQLLNLAVRHPGIWHIFRERAARLLAKVEQGLTPVALAVARQTGQSMTLDEAAERAIQLL